MSKIVSLSLILFLIACSKKSRVEKSLAGTWNIDEYNFTDSEGLTYKSIIKGNFNFTNHEINYNYTVINNSDTTFFYQSNASYQLNSSCNQLDFTDAQNYPRSMKLSLLTKHHLIIIEKINGLERKYQLSKE